MNSGQGTGADGGGSLTRPFVMLALIALVETLGMAPWFAGNAAAAEIATRFGLDATMRGWLTSAVQLGFVVGTLLAALLNLPDIVPSRWYVATAAAAAALLNATLLVAPSWTSLLAGRFLLGAALAGVYPPAMKMAATWFARRRGLAIGVVVGALTVGKASPYLVEALGGLGLGAVVWSTSGAALAAAVVVAVGYRDGPHAFPRRPFAWRLVGEVVRVHPLRLATAGYLGHMWELYTFWTFVGAYWSASLQTAGRVISAPTVALLTFASIAVGVVGCVWGGIAADRLGRERVVIAALAASGVAALGSGLVFGRSLVVVLPVILLWGVAVIADSAQFSALVTDLAPAHAVGTALTLQTSAGFLLTMMSIQLTAALGGPATGWAFPLLAAGPVLGIVAIRRLMVLRAPPLARSSPAS